jgi:polyisoprenoid-binding protein YceI
LQASQKQDHLFRIEGTSMVTISPLALSPLLVIFLGTSPSALTDDTGVRKFVAENRVSNNQIVFSLETKTEKVTGLSNEPRWVLSLNPDDVAGTLHGEMSIAVKSLDTGKREHNEKLLGSEWLDAAKHPEIRIELKSAKEVKKLAGNDWNIIGKGVATVRGKDYDIDLKFKLTYLPESAETRERAPGHLLVLRGSFELPQDVFGSAGDGDRTITLDLRLFGSTESTTGKPGAPTPVRRPANATKSGAEKASNGTNKN